MPIVRRRDRYGEKHLQWGKWNELTRAEKGRKVYGRAAGAIAVATLTITYGAEIKGAPDENISRDQQTAELRSEAKETYANASLLEKYTMEYIKPLRMRADNVTKEGSGIMGSWIANNGNYNFKTAKIRAGRSCLKDTAYDVTSKKTPVAAFNVEQDSVSVHPTAAGARSLHFVFDPESGTLQSRNATAEILKGYNCRFIGSIPVRTSYEITGGLPDWQLEEPLIAPAG